MGLPHPFHHRLPCQQVLQVRPIAVLKSRIEPPGVEFVRQAGVGHGKPDAVAGCFQNRIGIALLPGALEQLAVRLGELAPDVPGVLGRRVLRGGAAGQPLGGRGEVGDAAGLLAAFEQRFAIPQPDFRVGRSGGDGETVDYPVEVVRMLL